MRGGGGGVKKKESMRVTGRGGDQDQQRGDVGTHVVYQRKEKLGAEQGGGKKVTGEKRTENK